MKYMNRLLSSWTLFGRSAGKESRLRYSTVLGTCLAGAFLLMQAPVVLAQNTHTLPLFMSASDTERQGFARIINRSDRDGTVTIYAIDDSGQEKGPVTLTIAANATVHFNSGELEEGGDSATDKGLSGTTGSGTGNWRLKLETDLDIEPLAYIRTPADGFLTSIHDVVQGESMRWNVAIFNPGRNANQKSLLRLINTSGIDTDVTITGLDDKGNDASGGEVQMSLPADEARLYSAADLEDGHSDFDGSLGAGSGKWQLFVSADRPIQVMSLMELPTRHITNLSSTTGDTIIRGGPGGDELWGGNDDDIFDPGDNGTSHDLDADRGIDTVHASMGDDMIIYSRSGEDAFQQLAYSHPDGDDHLGSGVTVTVDGTANRATVVKGAAGTDTIVDINKALEAIGVEILGTNFNDVFDLTMDDEQYQFINIEAGGGNDTFDVQLNGGWVRVDYEYAPAGINADLSAGRVSNDGHGDADTFRGDIPRSIAGSNFSDVILGSDRDEWFMGRGGNDDLDGGGGSDMLQFGFVDRFAAHLAVTGLQVDLDAGTASGSINGSPFSHSIANFERIWGGTGSDTIRGKIGEIRGSPGNDRFDFTTGENDDVYSEFLYGNLTTGGITVTLNGSTGRATVNKGSAGNDTIEDLAGVLDWNYGGLGIYGTDSNDVFNLTMADEQWIQVGGDAGNDRFNIQARAGYGLVRLDYKNAEHGIDIDLAAGRARDDGFGDVDTISGPVWQIRGSDFSDVMRGSGNNEHFIGRRGDDTIDGRGGFDTLRMDRDCCATVRNLDVDLGDGTANGTWNGETFSYRLSSIEAVRGGNGSDTFSGSSRDEQFTGKGGDDVFIFEGAHGHDRIKDFTNGDDVIVLLGLNVSKQDVLNHAWAWNEGVGVHIDLTSFGGGKIDLERFRRDDFDASDFLL